MRFALTVLVGFALINTACDMLCLIDSGAGVCGW